MDRDSRHERIKIAYEGMVQGIGDKVDPGDLVNFVQQQYDAGITDEFLKPIIVDTQGRVGDGDTLLFFDFRSDRMRQISEAFGITRHFQTEVVPDVSITTLTQYKADFPFPNLFPPVSNQDTLAEWLSKQDVRQYHCAGVYTACHTVTLSCVTRRYNDPWAVLSLYASVYCSLWSIINNTWSIVLCVLYSILQYITINTPSHGHIAKLGST